jgi:hypothetical protein
MFNNYVCFSNKDGILFNKYISDVNSYIINLNFRTHIDAHETEIL